MKKLITILFFTIVVMNTSAIAADQSKNTALISVAQNDRLTSMEVSRLSNRLEQIHQMDFKKLSANEKLELRQEVTAIKQRFSEPLGGGVYISAGALILIIILLIIIL